jgi:hypothetical protein
LTYNAGLDEDIDLFAMAELVKQYNAAPHATLTKYGPGFPISPTLAQQDPDLEMYICRRISQENMEVRRAQGFGLAVGSRCLVYNDISPMDKRRSAARDENFVVVQHERGKYRLRGERSGVLLWLPRWKIKPVEK